MKIRKPTPEGAVFAGAAVVLSLALVPAAVAGKPSGGSGGSSAACSISPGQVALDQDWTVSARGLPTGATVNRIITFPNGASSTMAITVNADGTYAVTGNSNMSASWGFITPEQTGTYTYQFVNKVRWPAGTWTKLYASCSVVVS
jgi:hypothetical protein